MNNTQQAGETANVTREALRIELWTMLSDAAKKEMLPLKESYLDSLMADIDSYAKSLPTPAPDAVEAKDRALDKLILFNRDTVKALDNMVDEMLRGHLPYAEPTPPAEGQKATVEAKSVGVIYDLSSAVEYYINAETFIHQLDKDEIDMATDCFKAGWIRRERIATPTSHAEGEKGAVGFAEWIGLQGWSYWPTFPGTIIQAKGPVWIKEDEGYIGDPRPLPTTLELYNLYLTC